MKALERSEYGGWETCRLVETMKPTVNAKQVLVSVHYAGVESAMLHLMKGEPSMLRLALGLKSPKNLKVGQSFSGEVLEIGDKISGFKPGDKVFGVCDGSFGEFAIAKPSKIAKIPSAIEPAQAAGLPVTAVAANAAIELDSTNPANALVIGGSGGVGSYLCQLLMNRGTKVTATSSKRKIPKLQSLGDIEVIAHEEVSKLPENSFQRIYIIGGSRSPKDYLKWLDSAGKVIVLGSDQAGSKFFGGFFTNFVQALRHPGKIKIVISDEDPKKLLRVAEKLKNQISVVEVVDGIENAISSIKRFEEGEIFGRLVVKISSKTG